MARIDVIKSCRPSPVETEGLLIAPTDIQSTILSEALLTVAEGDIHEI